MKKQFSMFIIFCLFFAQFSALNYVFANDDNLQMDLFSEDVLDKFIQLGQYDEAITYCNQILINPNANSNDIRNASYGLGKIYFVQGKVYTIARRKSYAIATISFLLPLAESGGHDFIDKVYYFLAESYYTNNQYPEAILYYQKYLEISNNLIDEVIYEKIGDAYRASLNSNEAIQYYQLAIDTHNDEPFTLQIKIGQQFIKLENYEKTIEYYKLVQNTTYNIDVVAQMIYKIGEVYEMSGNSELAFTYYQNVVNDYTESSSAYNALIQLVEENQPVSEYTRGLIDFKAGAFPYAIDAFNRYMDQIDERPIDVLFYMGLCNFELGKNESAQLLFEEIITRFDYYSTDYDTSFYSKAFEQLGLVFEKKQEDFPKAINLYLDFASKFPHDNLAPEFVYYAASLYEIDGHLKEAAQWWLRVAQSFQNSPLAFEAIILSGISYYRLGDYSTALSVFDTASSYQNSSEEFARVVFWKGKIQQALENPAEAVNYYTQATIFDPYSYYGLRASQILNGDSPFSMGMYDIDINLSVLKKEAESWMITKFGLPQAINLSDISQLDVFPEFQRGLIFYELEEYDFARKEFYTLKEQLSGSAHYLYLFGHAMLDLGFYRNGIISLVDVLYLAEIPNADLDQTPPYFNYIRYGLYYWDLVYLSSSKYNLDPFFILSTMRQESLFDQYIASDKGAIGLMQIMPATGQEINSDLGNYVSGYESSDLLHPNINIYFGNFYLSQLRSKVDTYPLVMLAGYNAGPRTAEIWLEKTKSEDYDLFVEIVRINETKTYLKNIFTFYEIYKDLYEVK